VLLLRRTWLARQEFRHLGDAVTVLRVLLRLAAAGVLATLVRRRRAFAMGLGAVRGCAAVAPVLMRMRLRRWAVTVRLAAARMLASDCRLAVCAVLAVVRTMRAARMLTWRRRFGVRAGFAVVRTMRTA
jgi:hypothetical protein